MEENQIFISQQIHPYSDKENRNHSLSVIQEKSNI